MIQRPSTNSAGGNAAPSTATDDTAPNMPSNDPAEPVSTPNTGTSNLTQPPLYEDTPRSHPQPDFDEDEPPEDDAGEESDGFETGVRNSRTGRAGTSGGGAGSTRNSSRGRGGRQESTARGRNAGGPGSPSTTSRTSRGSGRSETSSSDGPAYGIKPSVGDAASGMAARLDPGGAMGVGSTRSAVGGRAAGVGGVPCAELAALKARKESPCVSAARYLLCVLPGAVGLVCMAFPMIYMVSTQRRQVGGTMNVAVTEVQQAVVDGINTARTAVTTIRSLVSPVPVTVLASLSTASSFNLWVMSTLIGCPIVRAILRDRNGGAHWRYKRLIESRRASGRSSSRARTAGRHTQLQEQAMIEARMMSQGTIQTNSPELARRNTLHSDPSSVGHLRRPEIVVATIESVPSDHNLFASATYENMTILWAMFMSNVVFPEPGSMLATISKVLFWVFLGIICQSTVTKYLLQIFISATFDIKAGEYLMLLLTVVMEVLVLYVVMRAIIGVGRGESMIHQMLWSLWLSTLMAISVYGAKVGLSAFLIALMNIRMDVIMTLLGCIILPLIFETLLVATTEIGYLRRQLLRTRSTALLVQRSIYNPKTARAAAMAGDELGLKAGQAILAGQTPEAAEYLLSVVAPIALHGGLLLSIPTMLLVISAPSVTAFYVSAFFPSLIRAAAMAARVWLHERRSTAASRRIAAAVAATSGSDASEPVGSVVSGYLEENRSSEGSAGTAAALGVEDASEAAGLDRPLSRVESTTTIAVLHLASSISWQAAIGIAFFTLLMLPDAFPSFNSNIEFLSGKQLDPVRFNPILPTWEHLSLTVVTTLTTTTAAAAAGAASAVSGLGTGAGLNYTISTTSVLKPDGGSIMLEPTANVTDYSNLWHQSLVSNMAPTQWPTSAFGGSWSVEVGYILLERCAFLIVAEWLIGALIAGLVSSPAGIVYGPQDPPNSDVRPLHVRGDPPIMSGFSATPRGLQARGGGGGGPASAGYTNGNLTVVGNRMAMSSRLDGLLPGGAGFVGSGYTVNNGGNASVLDAAGVVTPQTGNGVVEGSVRGFSVVGSGVLVVPRDLGTNQARRNGGLVVGSNRVSSSMVGHRLMQGLGSTQQQLTMQEQLQMQIEDLRMQQHQVIQVHNEDGGLHRRQKQVMGMNAVLDPRPWVVSVFEFVRAMGTIGIAIATFWGAVWGAI